MSTDHLIYEDGLNEVSIRERGYRLFLEMDVQTQNGPDLVSQYESREISVDDVVTVAAKILATAFIVSADDAEVTRKFKNAMEERGFPLAKT